MSSTLRKSFFILYLLIFWYRWFLADVWRAFVFILVTSSLDLVLGYFMISWISRCWKFSPFTWFNERIKQPFKNYILYSLRFSLCNMKMHYFYFPHFVSHVFPFSSTLHFLLFTYPLFFFQLWVVWCPCGWPRQLPQKPNERFCQAADTWTYPNRWLLS